MQRELRILFSLDPAVRAALLAADRADLLAAVLTAL